MAGVPPLFCFAQFHKKISDTAKLKWAASVGGLFVYRPRLLMCLRIRRGATEFADITRLKIEGFDLEGL
jgi:hypothetical protein